MAENKGKIPQRWGTSEAKFYADLEGEKVRANLTTSESVIGELVGVDTYAVFVEMESGYTVLVAKHSISTVLAWPFGPGEPSEAALAHMENPPHE